MRLKTDWLFVCHSADLGEGQHVTLDINYRGAAQSAIVFRFNNRIYAYINQCVHMPKRLNCERDMIFDESGQMLRCSMHGIVYNPTTGISQSTMCNGEQLQSIRAIENENSILIIDKRVSVPNR